MQNVTWKEMKAIDLNAAQLGLLPIQLMESAGAAITQEIKHRFSRGKILFIAGRGNNGGDACVAARHLSEYTQFETNLILLGNAESIKSSEAKSNFLLLKHCKINYIKEIVSLNDPEILHLIDDADVIVDGILGTGVIGNIKEPEAFIVDLINNSKKYIISIDTPSGNYNGINAKSVKANLTITFHKMKRELVSSPLAEFAGEVIVSKIGICNDAWKFVGKGNLVNLYKRTNDLHKGQAGKILIIAGGAYFGAPALTALGALRTGADIVTIATPENVADIVASFSPDLIVRRLSKSRLCADDLPTLNKLIKLHDVVVIGMGLGKEKDIIPIVKQIIPLCKKIVIDADALDSIENKKYLNQEIIITPHAREFERIAKIQLSEEIEQRIEQIVNYTRDRNIVALLKGKIDIISDGKRILLNRTGNPGMSVGGTGDVLAGITGALLAVNSSQHAASCAAYISGAAGDLAYLDKGYGLIATDVINKITDVMNDN